MNTDEELTSLFHTLEDSKESVRVSFRDGDSYELQIVSAQHAEEGGDVVANVLTIICDSRNATWKSSAMNFRLEDVASVETVDGCLFRRTTT